jgi:hypothetical protein
MRQIGLDRGWVNNIRYESFLKQLHLLVGARRVTGTPAPVKFNGPR